MKTEVCNWCHEAPVHPGYKWGCKDCTFKCPECKYDLPLEVGHGDCQSCDGCCFSHEESHIEY